MFCSEPPRAQEGHPPVHPPPARYWASCPRRPVGQGPGLPPTLVGSCAFQVCGSASQHPHPWAPLLQGHYLSTVVSAPQRPGLAREDKPLFRRLSVALPLPPGGRQDAVRMCPQASQEPGATAMGRAPAEPEEGGGSCSRRGAQGRGQRQPVTAGIPLRSTRQAGPPAVSMLSITLPPNLLDNPKLSAPFTAQGSQSLGEKAGKVRPSHLTPAEIRTAAGPSNGTLLTQVCAGRLGAPPGTQAWGARGTQASRTGPLCMSDYSPTRTRGQSTERPPRTAAGHRSPFLWGQFQDLGNDDLLSQI